MTWERSAYTYCTYCGQQFPCACVYAHSPKARENYIKRQDAAKLERERKQRESEK